MRVPLLRCQRCSNIASTDFNGFFASQMSSRASTVSDELPAVAAMGSGSSKTVFVLDAPPFWAASTMTLTTKASWNRWYS